MAAAIASRGHDVIGVDVNHRAVDALNAGHAPVQETGLQSLIEENRARLRATMSHEEAIADSELTFVIVPTPSDERGAFSLQYAAYAFREIGKALATSRQPHRRADQHRAAGSDAARPAADPRAALGEEGRRRFRSVLQPGVHRARQRHSRLPEPGLSPDR